MKWFFIDESITDGERRKGPYSIEEIREFVKQGTITEQTLVWHSGEECWRPWKEAEESIKNPEIDSDAAREELLQNTIRALEEAMQNDKIKVRRFAGFFTRAVAYIIDNVILGIAGGIILFVISAAGLLDLTALQSAAAEYMQNPTSAEAVDKLTQTPGMSTFMLIWSIIYSVYTIVFQAYMSATPGKRLLHIHIETHEGDRLNWLSSIARYLCSVLTQFTMVTFFGLGYLIVCIDPKRRALHDWIARTYVVYDEESVIKKPSEKA